MIGHHLTKAAILDNVHKFWDFAHKFPVPRRPIKCPVCSESTVMIKGYNFFHYPERGIPHRCDIAFKCLYCSAVWAHGLPITLKQFEAVGPKKSWTWRAVLDTMNGIHNEEDYGYIPDKRNRS